MFFLLQYTSVSKRGRVDGIGVERHESVSNRPFPRDEMEGDMNPSRRADASIDEMQGRHESVSKSGCSDRRDGGRHESVSKSGRFER